MSGNNNVDISLLSLNRINIFYIISLFIINLINLKRTTINISRRYVDSWFALKNGLYKCGSLKCIISDKINKTYDAIIYSRTFYFRNVTKRNKTKNILLNLEALSRWKILNKIIEGVDKKFDILISYKLLISKHHISYTYYYDIDDVINRAKESIISINEFMKRKSIIFLYKIPYRKRNRLCKMFEAKILVDKYGSAFKNHLSWPKNISNRIENKYKLIRKYKFCLAIENAINQVEWGQMYSDPIDEDYITEKLWDCMKGGAMPIYFGAKNIKDFVPNNSTIISFNDYHNYSEVINYVASIINKRNIISRYIKWPYRYSKKWHRKMKKYSFSPCRICNALKYAIL